MANVPLYFGPIVFLALIEMDPDYGARMTLNFIDYFLTIEGAMIARAMRGFTESYVHDKFLEEYLTDPVRRRKYVLDGPQYALVGRFLLDCFIQPCPEQEFPRQVVSLPKLSLD